ncbi:MAG: hypothetical protein RIR70_1937 [Pseudomonadota bacterium]|jgi:hypothetical protein
MISFKSRATESVMMFDEVGKQLLDIMGKVYSPDGIITVEQLPQAIERLNRAAEQDREAARARVLAEEQAAEEEGVAVPPRAIGLSQRAVPLIDILTRSLKAQEPVIWVQGA